MNKYINQMLFGIDLYNIEREINLYTLKNKSQK